MLLTGGGGKEGAILPSAGCGQVRNGAVSQSYLWCAKQVDVLTTVKNACFLSLLLSLRDAYSRI